MACVFSEASARRLAESLGYLASKYRRRVGSREFWNSMTARKVVLSIVLVLATLELALLVFGGRILISEYRVRVGGPPYFVEDYGNLAENGQDSLVCRYFTGRGVLTRVFWYSSNNILGRDSCPFLTGSN